MIMSLSKWNELPSLDLYLDQVLLYVNQETETFLSKNEKPLTASMINNYVKNGFLPKPEKKKYGRIQLARLIVLSICKTVFSISDIAQMIDVHYKDRNSQLLYDTFVDCLEGKSQPNTPELISKACQTILVYKEAMELIEQLREEK
ncbi:BS_ykrK family protein [Streptococcus varani]|uniref:BS_ykrK family protein n=1 Tax=Streptococcus varani TaxID=1608583 RepID=A0A0E4CT19_9STRE|nr:DUF1836 domain-containing protein [Streptococcus varani]CQR25201.1 BS_ykrK family protein [Streptococcus varani]